jgi:hypothetical protein
MTGKERKPMDGERQGPGRDTTEIRPPPDYAEPDDAFRRSPIRCTEHAPEILGDERTDASLMW